MCLAAESGTRNPIADDEIAKLWALTSGVQRLLSDFESRYLV